MPPPARRRRAAVARPRRPRASPPTSSTACCASKRAARRAAPARTRIPASPLARPRPRADARPIVATVLRRLGTLAASARAAISTRASRRRAARSKTILLIGAAQILLARRARPCRGRSVGAAGAGRPPRRALCRAWSTPCCAASRETARACWRPRHGAARHAGLAAGALDARTTATDRARAIARGQRPRAGARSHRQDRSRKSGPNTLRRPRAADRHGAHARARRRSRCCRASTTAPGGCRTPPPRCRRGCSATSRGKTRRRSLRRARRQDRAACARPARRSPPSTARRRGSSALRAESRAAQPRRRDRRRRRAAVARRAVRRACCSTRPAPRPARSAAIPTFPGSSPKPIIATLAALQRRLLDRAVDAARARRHARLLHLLAGAGGRRAADRGACWRATRACAASRSQPDEIGGHAELAHRRTATCAPCRCHLARSRAAHGRARRLLRRPARRRL